MEILFSGRKPEEKHILLHGELPWEGIMRYTGFAFSRTED